MKHVRRTWIWMVKYYLDLHFEGLALHVQQGERCMENTNTETQRGNAKALLTEKEIRSWRPRRPAVIAGAQVLLLILHNLPCCAQEPWQGWAGIATMPLFASVRGMFYYLFNNLTFFSLQVSFQLLISLMCHRDTGRPTSLITLNAYFLKCNIYSYLGTLPHIGDFLFSFFFLLSYKKWGVRYKKK